MCQPFHEEHSWIHGSFIDFIHGASSVATPGQKGRPAWDFSTPTVKPWWRCQRFGMEKGKTKVMTLRFHVAIGGILRVFWFFHETWFFWSSWSSLFLVALVSRRLHAVAELYLPPNIYILHANVNTQLANFFKKTIRDMCFKFEGSLLSFWRGFCLAPSQSGCHWGVFTSCRHYLEF